MASTRMKRLGYLSGILLLSTPVTLPAASRFFRTTPRHSDDYFYNFYVDCGPAIKSKPAPNSTPIPAHEWKARSDADGLHLRLYMAGVAKENLKVWFEGGDLIAEGKKEKDFEDEDDNATLMRYRVLSPPDKKFNLGAMEANINNGLLKVFVPRKGEDDYYY